MVIQSLNSIVKIRSSLCIGRGSRHLLTVILLNQVVKSGKGTTGIALVRVIVTSLLSLLQSSSQSLRLNNTHHVGNKLNLNVSDSITITKAARITLLITRNQTNHIVTIFSRLELYVKGGVFLRIVKFRCNSLKLLAQDTLLVNDGTIFSANSIFCKHLSTKCTLVFISIPLSGLQSQVIGCATLQGQLVILFCTIQGNTSSSTTLSQIKNVSGIACSVMHQTVT